MPTRGERKGWRYIEANGEVPAFWERVGPPPWERAQQPAPAARGGATSTRPGWTFYPESDEHPAHWLCDGADLPEINATIARIQARIDRDEEAAALSGRLPPGPSPEHAAAVAGRVAEPDITTPEGAYADARAWAQRQPLGQPRGQKTEARQDRATSSPHRAPHAGDPTDPLTPAGAYADARRWAERQTPQRHGAAAPSVSRESPPFAVDPTTPAGAYAAAQQWAARQVAAGRR